MRKTWRAGGIFIFIFLVQRVRLKHLAAAGAWPCQTGPLVLELFYFFKFFCEKLEEWARAFERMGVQHPHFLKLAPTLGSVESLNPHRAWRFYFFSNSLFAKIRGHMDFISTIGILVS
jgi:hypothetical protein